MPFTNDPRITVTDQVWIKNLQTALYHAKLNKQTEVTVSVLDLESVLHIVTYFDKP